MNSSRTGKNCGRLFTAVFLLTLGAVGLYLGLHNHLFRSLGLLAIMMAMYVIKPRSRQSDPPAGAGADLSLRKVKRPAPLLWGASLALVPILGIALLLVHNDAANGGHEVWPLDVLFGVILVCCVMGNINDSDYESLALRPLRTHSRESVYFRADKHCAA